MSKKSSNAKEAVKIDKKSNTEYIYLSEEAKKFKYSDYVKVRSGLRGVLLSFGFFHPEECTFVVTDEIILPHDIAFSLKDIIGEQLEKMEKEGLLKIEGRNG